MKFFDFFFRPKAVKQPASEPAGIKPEEQRILQLESEIAGLKLTLAGLQQTIENQRQLAEDSEKNREKLLSETLDSRLQNLFTGLAAPLAQLSLLQSMELEGREIKAANIFKLVSAIGNELEEAGLQRVFNCNEIQPFDAGRMNPVMAGTSFTEGEKVMVRLPGYVFKDKYICKPLVDKLQ